MMRLVTVAPSPLPSTALWAPAFSAASRFSALISTLMMFWCFSAFSTAMAFRPSPPAPDQHDRLRRRQRHRLLDGGIDGDAGAGIGRGHGGIEAAGIDQMPRMRRNDVGAVAAVLVDAQAAGRDRAHVVFLGQALLAFAAAQPGVDDAQVADLHARWPRGPA